MEELFFALEIVFIGFTTVIVALFILYLLLVGLGRLAGSGSLQKGIGSQSAAAAGNKAAEVKNPPNSPWLIVSAAGSLSPGLLAALTASVYAVISENQAKRYRFQVVPPVKTAGESRHSWAAEGRKALFEGPEKIAALRRKKSCCESSK